MQFLRAGLSVLFDLAERLVDFTDVASRLVLLPAGCNCPLYQASTNMTTLKYLIPLLLLTVIGCQKEVFTMCSDTESFPIF